MNVVGLCSVLTKYVGTEVTVGPKRGAKAARDIEYVPAPETQFKATLVLENVDSPGRPHVRREYFANIQKLVETITTEHVARCGQKIESFKGSTYPQDILSKLRGILYTEACLSELRAEGFALADLGSIIKINSQSADVGYLSFTVTFAEVVAGDPQMGFIDKASGTGTISGGVAPITKPFSST